MYKKEVFLEIDTNLHSPIQSMEADSNSRLIRFNLTNNYMPFRLTGKKVIFKAVKPDGTDIVNDCIIIDEENGIIEVEITKQINAISGRVNCQLSIIGADDYVLKTKKFIISVDSKLNQSGVVSSKEYKTLENALAKVQSIDENFDKVNTAILELATKGTTVEVIERATKQEIDRQIADGTIAHLTIQDGSVTPEKTSFYGEVASHEKVLKNAQTDYMGNARGTVKEAMDSNVDWLLGEINTVHYDGQHITATDSIEGQCKSAILKGCTLVNLLNDEVGKPTAFKDYNILSVKENTKYIIFIDLTSPDSPTNTIGFLNEDGSAWRGVVNNVTSGISKHIIETQSGVSNKIRFHTNKTGVNGTINRLMIIEYQEGMENWDIPYFTGMQSVRMPVLTTVWKNLFDETYSLSISSDTVEKLNDGSIKFYQGAKRLYISPTNGKFEKNTQYTISYTKVSGVCRFSVDYTDGTVLEVNPSTVKVVVTTAPNKTILRIKSHYGDASESIIKDIQIEKGTQATPYEPYKSNILTVNEPIELRGIGNVKDELDCLTGQVTKRIEEFVLNGSEAWRMSEATRPNHLRAYCSYPSLKYYQRVINDTFADNGDIKGKDVEGIYMSNTIDIQVAHSRLSEVSVNGFKNWLRENNIKVQAILSQESIKTVDLSDNHVYSYKGTTHYDCSSAEGSLVPTLSIDVPTNLPAVVTRQRVTIQELEKENVALKNEIEETANSSVNGDLELMSSQFELDFRLFEIEMNLDMPMMAMMRGVKSMAMTVYQQAKTLILAGKYEREDMEYKLNRYKAAGRIAVEEYEELIALMDARELVD